MKRTKEEMLETREHLILSAFDCFSEYGYEKTSLAEVAERAGVTRGALYWHFQDKYDLFKTVVAYAIEKGDVAKYGIELKGKIHLVERLEKVFTISVIDNKWVEFIYKMMSFTAGRDGFDEILQELRKVKHQLIQFFFDEVNRYIEVKQPRNRDAENYCYGLYFLFEGLFLSKNLPIGLPISEDNIRIFILQTLGTLLTEADLEQLSATKEPFFQA